MRKFLVAALVFFLLSDVCLAQSSQSRRSGPRRQLATIIFTGLGGAILGLSTLSFYPRPQDNLVNIAIGFAVGVIAGTTYVTVRSATSRDYYDSQNFEKYDHMPDQNLVFSPYITNAPSLKPDGLGAQMVYRF